MPDYVKNNNISGTSQLLRSTRYQVSRGKRDRERKKRKEKKRKENEKWNKTNVHAQGAGRVLRGRGCCLLVVRSVLWCVHLMDNRRTTRKARRRTSQDEGRDKAEKNTTRWWVFVEFVFAWCFEWSGVTSYRDIYRGIISHIIRYHKIRCIEILFVSTSRIFGTDIEISYPVDIFLDSEHHFLPS